MNRRNVLLAGLGAAAGALSAAATRAGRAQTPAGMFLASETCGVADMLVLAVKLSDAGLGDHWDDVDTIARNHLVAQQIKDGQQMRALGGGDAQKDALLERLRGAFNQQQMEGTIDSTGPHAWGCCTANGAVGLYYAWHGITRFDEPSGTATVNLLLNHAAPWLDVDSWLPYEGRATQAWRFLYPGNPLNQSAKLDEESL